jgi:hypothetical protein
MNVKQISVFLENKCGRLASVTRILEANDVNIRALSIADTSDFGILRIVVDQPEKAFRILKENGFVATETSVIAVGVPDRPGGLAEVLEFLDKAEINIEYLYSFVEKPGKDALIMFRVDNPLKATDILQQHGVVVVESEKVYRL